MSNEVKFRKKTQPAKNSNLSEPAKTNGKDEAENEKMAIGNSVNKPSGSSSLDFKMCLCLLTIALCGVLTWAVLQQNERFSELENNYKLLHEKTAGLFTMEEEVLKVSNKCETKLLKLELCQGVQVALEGLGAQHGSVRPQLEGLQRDASQLSEWASGSTEKRQQLQGSLAALTNAVGQIEKRTAAITTDVTNKVASVKTDVRRMEGLQSEVESLLSQVGELEDKALQAERTMVKRIADLLAASIDRVSALRAASEENAHAINKLQRQIPPFTAADQQISERLRELESGRARLVRTVTFAGDLKPKVASIKRDFAMFEPRLSDLTLRIGRLAEDLTNREQEVAELRQTLANLTAVEQVQLNLADIPDVEDSGLLLQGHVSNALPQTETSAE